MADHSPIITLTTDFGFADGTVGAMIGVIKSICPQAEVVNLATDIPPQDVHRGAWALFQAAPFFPSGTIHVCVVDPGVGSARRGLLVVTDHGQFIGPDNGVLSWAWRGLIRRQCSTLENPSYRIARVGVTFDGRDLFAPAAAYLASGADPASFGSEVNDPMELEWPDPVRGADTISGEILVIDHFGNLITNVTLAQAADAFGDQPFAVHLPGGATASFVGHYAGIRGELGAVVNGSGLIEIAARNRSAAEVTRIHRGANILLEKEGDRE
ncbi:MAG: SAM-dependent chlorinase/fluorinase [Candidatus Zixiibacteriota bacterium]